MQLCIQAGVNAKADGFCCVAIGDSKIATGRFQVEFGGSLTLDGIPIEELDKFVLAVNAQHCLYQNMEEQSQAPSGFCRKVRAALGFLFDEIAKYKIRKGVIQRESSAYFSLVPGGPPIM
jgi:hypothetical protein